MPYAFAFYDILDSMLTCCHVPSDIPPHYDAEARLPLDYIVMMIFHYFTIIDMMSADIII